MSALNIQVGGNHYMTGIQPVEYIHANGLNFFEGNVVKYVTRHKSKNGVSDLKKALHYCQMMLELDYGVKAEVIYAEEDQRGVETSEQVEPVKSAEELWYEETVGKVRSQEGS